jgi:hypothetical protein
MSQDNKVVQLLLIKKRKNNDLSDKEKLVFSYHYFDLGNEEAAIKLLCTVGQVYYMNQFHKDISRALLCQATYKTTQDYNLGKESEFYIIVYKLVVIITSKKLVFTGSGHFYQLKDELFQGFLDGA